MKQSRYVMIFSLFLVFFLPVHGLAQNEGSLEKKINGPKLLEGFVYFTDALQVSLKSEKIRFPSNLDDHQLGKEIVNVLMKGPSRTDLKSIWPTGIGLNAFFISDDGNAYVDLNVTREMTKGMDTRLELLASDSPVNSLTLNIPQIKKVKILVAGSEPQTLAGHMDTDYFYQTNMLIVK